MKIKVCGMLYPENISEVTQLSIDMIGLIFYGKSPRYAGMLHPDNLSVIPRHIDKVGVFVDETLENILMIAGRFDLQIIQLHGNESPELCGRLRSYKYKVVKVFSISDRIDNDKILQYENYCDYILFDTKTSQHGGSGKQFDWTILSTYNCSIPYFLSGGIGPDDMKIIRQLSSGKLYAVDLNSRFEIKPGLKDINKLAEFIK